MGRKEEKTKTSCRRSYEEEKEIQGIKTKEGNKENVLRRSLQKKDNGKEQQGRFATFEQVQNKYRRKTTNGTTGTFCDVRKSTEEKQKKGITKTFCDVRKGKK